MFERGDLSRHFSRKFIRYNIVWKLFCRYPEQHLIINCTREKCPPGWDSVSSAKSNFCDICDVAAITVTSNRWRITAKSNRWRITATSNRWTITATSYRWRITATSNRLRFAEKTAFKCLWQLKGNGMIGVCPPNVLRNASTPNLMWNQSEKQLLLYWVWNKTVKMLQDHPRVCSLDIKW